MEKVERSYFRRVYEAVSSIIISPRYIDTSDSTSEEDQPQVQYHNHHYRQNPLLQTSPRNDELVSLEYDPCLSCADPCSTHPGYPSYLKIDYRTPLEGTVKPYVKHVLISTGKSDWSTNIEDECCSLAAHLHKVVKSDKVTPPSKIVSNNNNKRDSSRKEKKNNKVEGSPIQTQQRQEQQQPTEKEPTEDSFNEHLEKPRIVITNSSRLNTDNNGKGNDVLLFPDNILIRNVTPKQASEFYKKFLSSNSSNGNGGVMAEKEHYSNIKFITEPMPYKAVIVICSHKRRDKRCGITGPLLRDEFDKVLKEKGLDVESHHNEGVAVFLSSHTGGHKFAGNVIVYRDGQGIWYGRVVPCHAKTIIETTVLEGKVIQELYRGSMNGSFAPGKGGKLDW
ncbi:hypothetical protein Glove_126g35 [Diversispora epigaea]|uniref:Sucrase/ferredoxin-like-domain-containing protein n=1 Tax=Diversispora epigaea TaxID=1348612 RepID=A0A397J4T0_9GLOM|nr:hypothetical protein Glove_126g35 [Diversispora epigaea]